LQPKKEGINLLLDDALQSICGKKKHFVCFSGVKGTGYSMAAFGTSLVVKVCNNNFKYATENAPRFCSCVR
jgi:hypothetical protein